MESNTLSISIHFFYNDIVFQCFKILKTVVPNSGALPLTLECYRVAMISY